MEIKESLKNLKNEAEEEIKRAGNQKNLEELRIKYLGKKGLLIQVLRSMSEIPTPERPAVGVLVNSIKEEITLLYRKKLEELSQKLEKGEVGLDLTLPGRKVESGRLHPISLILDEVVQIFKKLGFGVVDGREVETEYYNFEALNTPEDHPARRWR